MVDEYPSPFRYNKVGNFIPRHLTRRITTQGGLCTIHPDPYKPVESDDMEKIIIPNGIRLTLKKTLNKYGVDRFHYFLAWMARLPILNGYSQRVIEVRPIRRWEPHRMGGAETS